MIKITISLLLFSSALFAQGEYPDKCRKKVPTNICIVDPKLNWNKKEAKIFHSFCRKKGTESYYVKNTMDLLDRFDILFNQCKSIKEIRFVGHAYAGHTDAGGLTLGDMDFWFWGYDELFSPGATIWITGCNAGRGCLGRLFIYELARTFLSKSGKVIAPDFYIVSLKTGSMDHASFSGKETMLTYKPQSSTPEKWNYLGLKRFNWKAGGIIKYCQNEIYDLIKNYQLEKTKAFKRGCNINKIPEVEALRESYLNIHKIFGLLERKRKKKITKDEKELLDEEYGASLDSFDKIRLAIKYFKSCKK